VLFRHVLRNALIPILTGVVAVLPLLFMGALITESFFGVPGLGSYTIDAINRQDFAIVRAMVFLGSVLYILGLILTDISYTMVDPRVRLCGCHDAGHAGDPHHRCADLPADRGRRRLRPVYARATSTCADPGAAWRARRWGVARWW
jgi:hypothetical protein